MSKRKTRLEEKIEKGFHRVLYNEMREYDILEKICGYCRTIRADKDNIVYYGDCVLKNYKRCNTIFKRSYECEEYKKTFE